MAGLAAYTARYVAAVVERDKIGDVIDLDPFDRCILLHRRGDLLYLWRFSLDLAVTVHARRGARHTRRLRSVSGRMAIEARDLVVAGVKLVRKIDRLHRFIAELIAIVGERVSPPNEVGTAYRDEHGQDLQRS